MRERERKRCIEWTSHEVEVPSFPLLLWRGRMRDGNGTRGNKWRERERKWETKEVQIMIKDFFVDKLVSCWKDPTVGYFQPSNSSLTLVSPPLSLSVALAMSSLSLSFPRVVLSCESFTDHNSVVSTFRNHTVRRNSKSESERVQWLEM